MLTTCCYKADVIGHHLVLMLTYKTSGKLDPENIDITYAISFILYLQADKQDVLFDSRHLRLSVTWYIIPISQSWIPKTHMLPIMLTCSYLVYQLSYQYFRFEGRHLGFPTSSYIVRHNHMIKWIF